MAWDGAPDGWVPPAERKAAEEAAASFERDRAAADERTRTLADAIAFGLDRIAMAIVAAGGDDTRHRFDRMNEPGELDFETDMGVYTKPDTTPQNDPELDALLEQGDDDPNG